MKYLFAGINGYRLIMDSRLNPLWNDITQGTLS